MPAARAAAEEKSATSFTHVAPGGELLERDADEVGRLHGVVTDSK